MPINNEQSSKIKSFEHMKIKRRLCVDRICRLLSCQADTSLKFSKEPSPWITPWHQMLAEAKEPGARWRRWNLGNRTRSIWQSRAKLCRSSKAILQRMKKGATPPHNRAEEALSSYQTSVKLTNQWRSSRIKKGKYLRNNLSCPTRICISLWCRWLI